MTKPTNAPPSGRSLLLYLLAFLATSLLACALGRLVELKGETGRDSIDGRTVAWLLAHRASWPAVTSLARLVTRLGDGEVAIPLFAGAGVTFLALRWYGRSRVSRRETLFWMAVPALGQGLSYLAKSWFGRDRPPADLHLVAETSASFPSGHAILAGELLVFALALALRPWSRWGRGGRALLALAAVALAAALASSRVWLGVHYVTDVVAGFLLGATWATSCVLIRDFRRAPATRSEPHRTSL